MPRFFIDDVPNGVSVNITGEDAHHITRVLRMKAGEMFTLCDSRGNDYICELEKKKKNNVTCKILKTIPSVGEPSVDITIYMALPKGDKMDFIVQKAVELGAKRIVPFIAKRSVSRPDEKSLYKKCDRWRKIAKEAAMQSERGAVPQVSDVLNYKQAVDEAGEHELAIFLYENEKETSIHSVLEDKIFSSVAIMIGPEGGFADEEVNTAIQGKMQSVSLGSRILRCETAPIAALSIVMYESGSF